jgi:hypothetical protein
MSYPVASVSGSSARRLTARTQRPTLYEMAGSPREGVLQWEKVLLSRHEHMYRKQKKLRGLRRKYQGRDMCHDPGQKFIDTQGRGGEDGPELSRGEVIRVQQSIIELSAALVESHMFL